MIGLGLGPVELANTPVEVQRMYHASGLENKLVREA